MARESRRIVVTGATGLIGRRIVQRLAGRGDHVIALVRDPERAARAAPGAARYVPWSSSAAEGPWTAEIDGADAVINLAGAPVAVRWNEESKRQIRDSRILGTRHIVEAIARAAAPPRTLINASAVGYYGTSDSKIFTEDSEPGTDFLGRTCREWEAEAVKGEALGVRVVLMRTGIVLEPHGGALARMLPTFKLFAGGPLGSGRQWFPWIHFDDEEELLLWALDNEAVRGPVNGVAPGIVTNGEFSTTLGRVLGRPSFFPVPKFALNLVFGEASYILTEGQRVVPERAEQLGFRFRHPELNEALRDLLEK